MDRCNLHPYGLSWNGTGKSNDPKHIAISLTGEPTLYTRLGEFIELANRRGISTFLVTNGTLPMVLEKLDPLPLLFQTVQLPSSQIIYTQRHQLNTFSSAGEKSYSLRKSLYLDSISFIV